MQTNLLKKGDVILVSLPRQLYTCIIVIKKEGNDILYYLADYLSMEKPNLNNPKLKEIYIDENMKFIGDGKIMKWGDEFITGFCDYNLIGNIEVNHLDDNSMIHGIIDPTISYWNWLKENFPEDYEQEINKFYDEDELNNNINISSMDDGRFWAIIQELYPEDLDNEYAIKKLTKYSREEIISFHNTLAKHLEILDKLPLKNNKYNSDDAFLYTRCFIIAQGLEYYNEVLEDGYIEEDLVEDSFEELLEITEEALQRANYNYDYEELLELK